jgi:hypothetical protein
MNGTFALLVVNIALSVLLLGTVFWTFHKVRKIHILTHQSSVDSQKIRQEVSSLYSHLEALYALQEKLALPTPLHSLRNWAGSPDFLLTLARITQNSAPDVVVECSSGSSTLVIARCLQLLGKGHVYSLEHDERYARKTIEMLRENDLLEWATVISAPLTPWRDGAVWYSLENLPDTVREINLLVVDGPPHDSSPLARLPALPALSSRLSADATSVLDDAARDAEKEIVRRWRDLDKSFIGISVKHEKGCYVLTRNTAVEAIL